jgi:hypothetical protein
MQFNCSAITVWIALSLGAFIIEAELKCTCFKEHCSLSVFKLFFVQILSKLFERQSCIIVSVHAQRLSNAAHLILRLFRLTQSLFKCTVVLAGVYCCFNAMYTPQAFCSAVFWDVLFSMTESICSSMPLCALPSFNVLREHKHITVTTLYIINPYNATCYGRSLKHFS